MKNNILFKTLVGLMPLLNLYSSDNVVEAESCILESSVPYGYTGDVAGKRVYTKEKFIYNCTKTVTEQGECSIWNDSVVENFDVSGARDIPVHFEEEDYSGSMGELLSLTQAYDKINNIWGGWSGICRKGKKDGNWDWLSDPYVLANYALAAYSAGAPSPTDAANTAGNAYVDGAKNYTSSGLQAAAEGAAQAAKYAKWATCAVGFGLDVGKMIKDFKDDEISCNPIDEFCDEEMDQDSQEFTISENEYNKLVNNNPEMLDYIKVKEGRGTGTLLVQVVNPGNAANLSEDERKKLAAKSEEIKTKMLYIEGLVTSIQLANCVLGAGNVGGNSGGDNDSSPTSAVNMANLAVSAISAANPLIGIGLDMAMKSYASLQDINTCTSKTDAEEKGGRHLATLQANKYGLCHFIREETKGSSLTLDKRKIKTFCCYDDTMTRVLVEQVKAQLGRDWSNCTGVTVDEIKDYVDFKACDATQLDNSIDGVDLPYDATHSQRSAAYQYTNKCIDTREIIDFMQKTFNGEDIMLDTESIEKQLELLR